jgi:hypothetical protein
LPSPNSSSASPPEIIDPCVLQARADALLGRRADLRSALALYDAALEQGADVLAIAGNQWRCAMLLGDFARAWRISDAVLAERQRRQLSCAGQPYHLRWVWEGQELRGHVLVRCYHGLGDVIQFIRLAAPLRCMTSRVTVQAVPQLLPLLAGVDGIDALIPLDDGRPEPCFDVDIELMEVPYAFRHSLATIPRDVPYIQTDPARVVHRRAELGGSGVPKVGLNWAAGAWRAERSVPLPLMLRLTEVADVTFVNLQRGAPLADLDALSRPVLLDWGNRTEDLLETATTVAALDLVISVDTMIAHLAGALAVPVWTLLHHDPDWRWMAARRDSPWYPTMRLYRQRTAGIWEDVLDEVLGDLRTFCGHATVR